MLTVAFELCCLHTRKIKPTTTHVNRRRLDFFAYEGNLTPHINKVNQLFYTMIVIARSLRRRRTDILDVGESAQDVCEQTLGEVF